MGRTVINETENKQTVILNDSAEGIEGGYFDADMVWHDLGGGGIGTKIIPYVIYDTLEPMGGGFVKSIDPDPESENPYELYTFAEMKQIVDSGGIFAYSLLDEGGATGRITIDTFVDDGGVRRERIVLHDAILSVPTLDNPVGYITGTSLFILSDNTVEVNRHYWTFAITNDD